MKSLIFALTITSVTLAQNGPNSLAMDVFTDSVYPILELHCVGCHSSGGIGESFSGGADSGMSFVDVNVAYERLQMPSFGDGGATDRLVPGDPDASSFYNKIVSTTEEVWYGDPMPPQGSPLIDSEPEAVETIRQWIAAGADGPAPVRDARSHLKANLFTYQISTSQGLIHFQAKGPIVELGVYDAVGKLVQEMHNMGSSLSLSYNLWQGGIYFVKITTDNQSEIQKLILH